MNALSRRHIYEVFRLCSNSLYIMATRGLTEVTASSVMRKIALTTFAFSLIAIQNKSNKSTWNTNGGNWFKQFP